MQRSQRNQTKTITFSCVVGSLAIFVSLREGNKGSLLLIDTGDTNVVTIEKSFLIDIEMAAYVA
jgi:hypothetical protein